MRAVLAGTGGRLPVALGVAAMVGLLLIRPWVDLGAGRFVFWAVLAVVTVGTVIAIVRRLHAMGHSGLWSVLAVVPVVGLGLLLWMMVGARGGASRAVGLRHTAGLAVIAGVGLFIASRAVWQPYAVQSDSMAPSVQAGDYLVVSRTPDIARGSVVVFRHPVSGADHILRVLGLPGDRIALRDGVVHLNGAPVTLDPLPPFVVEKRPGPAGGLPPCANDPVDLGARCETARYLERVPDATAHAVLDLGPTILDETAEVSVPQGTAFVLGDHRDNAIDSRVPRDAGGPGLVPLDAIHSEAVLVAFNTAGRGRHWTRVP